MTINLTSVSGEHIYQESGAIVNISGQPVDISGAFVQISGQGVNISGQHVFIESGAHVVADVDVVVSSGLWVDGVSGVHVFVESGLHVVADVAVEVSSGLWVDGISGTHVFPEYYAIGDQGPNVHVDMLRTDLSGNLFVLISGQAVTISGNHVFVESGVNVTAQIKVDVSSGLWIILPGTQVSGAIIVSGNVGTSVSGNWVEAHILSGSEVSIFGGINVSGSPVKISGETVSVASGTEIIWRGIQVSGTVAVSGTLSANVSGQWVEAHILSGIVNVSSGLIDILGGISGTVGLISGAQVITQPFGQVSGCVLISGQVYMTSGLVAILSGEIHILSGSEVSIFGGINVSGSPVKISGETISVASGAEIIWRGIQISGAVIVSGTASISGNYINIDSGLEIIWRGVQVSGSLSANMSGQWVEAHILSGAVTIISGGVFISGSVTILSGIVDIYTPTSILTNDLLTLTNDSGGLNLVSGAIKSVVVKALVANSGDVYIGGHASPHKPYSGHGLCLAPSEAVVIDIANLGYVYCFGTISGFNRVSYLGTV